MSSEVESNTAIEFAESVEQLRAIYGAPSAIAAKKELTFLDAHCCNFIAHSPFVCISTASRTGLADVSPRGDAAGFVRILDSQTLLIPDRLGNNRIDTLRNIVENPEVGLLFLVPGVDETLRVNGTGRVVLRSKSLDECSVGGKPARSGLLVNVREAFLQCAKALKRSHLWGEKYRVERNRLPSLGQMLTDQIGLEGPVCDLDEIIETAYREKLY